MKYRCDLSSPVDHYYLGFYKDYKVWQDVQPLSNKTSPGHSRYVLLRNDECCYPQAKWSEELTKLFFPQLEKICLKYAKNYTNIHYLGMCDNNYVWEVWNIHDRSREWGLPHLITFNGSRYELIQDRHETMILVEFFLRSSKLSS